MADHAAGARSSMSGGELDQHKDRNPGELLGHSVKDLPAVSGRVAGGKAAPGGSGMTPNHPAFGRGSGN